MRVKCQCSWPELESGRLDGRTRLDGNKFFFYLLFFFLTESLQKILTPEDILSNSINHKTKERRSAS